MNKPTVREQLHALIQLTRWKEYVTFVIPLTLVGALLAAQPQNSMLDLRLAPNGDFAGMVQSINPSVIRDVRRGETVHFDVTFNRGRSGPGEQRFVFRLDVIGAETAVIQEVPVIVNLR